MIEERIVISDANILFDLLSVGLLDAFFAIPWNVFTTDLVIAEIEKPGQKEGVERFVKSKKLSVITFELNELFEISGKQEACKNNASMADVSVWYYAKKVNGRLLTGDRKLRSVAENEGVRVSGVLYIFEKMIENNIISHNEAAENLEELVKINGRLPKEECEKRINEWRKNSM